MKNHKNIASKRQRQDTKNNDTLRLFIEKSYYIEFHEQPKIARQFNVFYSKKMFSKNVRLNYLKGDYNVPKNWENNFKENSIFPSNYWCVGFDIKK